MQCVSSLQSNSAEKQRTSLQAVYILFLATYGSDITNIETVRLMEVNTVKTVKDALKYSLIRIHAIVIYQVPT